MDQQHTYTESYTKDTYMKGKPEKSMKGIKKT